MDVEDSLKKLQSLFSYAASAAIAAKTRYLALTRQDATAASLARARTAWRQFEAQKTAIIARMVAMTLSEYLRTTIVKAFPAPSTYLFREARRAANITATLTVVGAALSTYSAVPDDTVHPERRGCHGRESNRCRGSGR